MARKTKEEALATRNKLLDTAERVFNEKGVSGTSLADIAEAAGLTRGAIYWHFKNKADLFEAMIQRVVLPMEEMVERFGDLAIEEPLLFIKAGAMNAFQLIEGDRQAQCVFEIMIHKCEAIGDMAGVRERQRDNRNECLEHVEQGFVNAVKKGQLPKSVQPRQAAIGMHALVDGLITNWVLAPGYFSLTKDGERILDNYLDGLKAQAPAKPRKVAGKAAGKVVRLAA